MKKNRDLPKEKYLYILEYIKNKKCDVYCHTFYYVSQYDFVLDVGYKALFN